MKIGVLTEEPNNEDVAIALKEAGTAAGAEVIIIDLNECAIVNTSTPDILYQGKSITELGLNACLIRGSENKLGFRTSIVEYLSDKGVIVINDANAIKICDNKFATQSLLNKAGIKTPDTIAIVKIEQLDAAVTTLNNAFPMIVKTVSGSHGVGVIKVESFESLKSITQYLLADNIDLMVQQFIPHTESGRIMILGDRVLASVMRTIPEGDFRSNMDQGAELKKHIPSEYEVQQALLVASTIGCKISAIDYIINADGEMIIFEANSSPGFKGIQSVNEEIDIAKEVISFIMSMVNPMELATDEEEEEALAKKLTKDDNYIAIQVGQGSAGSHEEEEEVQQSANNAEAPVNAPVESCGDEEEEESSLIGLTQPIIIKRINNDQPFDGKVDTGADRCSLHGDDIEIGDNYVRFLLNDTRYKVPLERFVNVLSANGSEKRPIVKFNVEFNGNSYNGIEFNISDRSGMKYQAIIGKNLLEVSGVIINPQE